MQTLQEFAKKQQLSSDEVQWLLFAYRGNEKSALGKLTTNLAENKPLFYGAPWVQVERKLLAGVAAKQSISLLSSQLRRPVSSLTSKLLKMGLLTEDGCHEFLASDGKNLNLSTDQINSLVQDFDKNEKSFSSNNTEKKSSGSKNLDKKTSQTEGIEVTEEFKRVLDYVESKQASSEGSAIFVTGVAGVGKSVLIGLLSSRFDNVCLAAPTGKASLNIAGATIHSVFSLGRVATVAALKQPRMALKPEKKAVLASFKNIVIDEISMCDAEIMQCIDLRLRQAKGNNLPFGGCNLIVVGDLLQLPPVVTAERAEVLDRYESPYFFSAPIIETVDMPVVQLTKTFRQKDPVLASMLNNIRVGENVYETLAWFNNKAYLEKRDQPTGSDTTFLVISNAEAWEINAKELAKLPGKETIYEAERTGTFLNKKDTPSGGTAPFSLGLKVGARVIVIKNGQGCVNGDMGRVTKLEENEVELELDNKSKVSLERASWEEVEYEVNKAGETVQVVKGECKQFPLLLGYAITTHRAQGMSLSCSTVKLPQWQRGKHYGPFNEGQVYVALSRIRSLDGLRLVNPIHPDAIKVSKVALDFYHKHGITHQISEVPDYPRKKTSRSDDPREPSNQSLVNTAAALSAEASPVNEATIPTVAPQVVFSGVPSTTIISSEQTLGKTDANNRPDEQTPKIESHLGDQSKRAKTASLTDQEATKVAMSYPDLIEQIKVKIGISEAPSKRLPESKEMDCDLPKNTGESKPSVELKKDVEPTVVGNESEEFQSAARLKNLDEQMLAAFSSIIDSEDEDSNSDSGMPPTP